MSTDDANSTPQARSPRQPPPAMVVIDGVKHYRPSFTPKAKHPSIELKLNLRTETAFRVFQAVFDPVQKVFYHLYATLPIACRDDRKVLDEAQTEVEGLLEAISKEISDEIERCKVKLRNDGADSITKYYNHEQFYAESLTPVMSRFLGVMVRMDEVLVSLDTVWMSDGMSENQHTQRMWYWRNRITRFNRAISTVHMRVMGEADRQAAAAAKAAAAATQAKTPAKAEKKVVAGKQKQKQQRRAGKVIVKVPEQSATEATPAAAAAAAAKPARKEAAAAQAAAAPDAELVVAAA